MKARYRLTLRAHQDLKEIARYTSKTWGRARRDAYLRDLEHRFRWLADNPELGRSRDDVGPGYRSYPHGVHVVFYLIRDGAIDIIGIPHSAMDLGSFFGPG